MPIYCKHCQRVHYIKPLTLDELDLFRVFLFGDNRKSYFCNEACYDYFVIQRKKALEDHYDEMKEPSFEKIARREARRAALKEARVAGGGGDGDDEWHFLEAPVQGWA